MAKDYAAIAASKIRQPSTQEPKRSYLVYSRNKKGKTRFCSTAPDVLILDPEVGTAEETKLDPDVWPIYGWDDMSDVLGFLKTNPVSPTTKRPYKWVAVDGLTRITNMSLRWVMRQAEERDLSRQPGQVGKQDYGKSGEMVKAMLHELHALPLNVIYTAQERMVTLDDEGSESDDDAENPTTIYVPDLPKGARGAVNAIVSVIGRLYVVNAPTRVKVNGVIEERDMPQRRLWIGPHVNYDTGYRSKHTLPDVLQNPTIPRLDSLISEGKTK